MINDLDLYSETILDHYQYPRHRGSLPHPTLRASESNPLCGDSLTLEVTLDEKSRLTDIAFSGAGCAISQASMSLLSETLVGKTVRELDVLAPEDVFRLLGVPISPARQSCALLGFSTLKKMIVDYADTSHSF
ncbi:MAG: iron-sulfur cluster assembly scaffold protein [Patescibacteria group bacterium]